MSRLSTSGLPRPPPIYGTVKKGRDWDRIWHRLLLKEDSLRIIESASTFALFIPYPSRGYIKSCSAARGFTRRASGTRYVVVYLPGPIDCV